MGMRIVAVGVALVLAGCAPDIWDKPGGTQEGFNIDQGGCQMYAMGMAPVQPAYIPPTYTSTTTASGTYMGGAGYGTVRGTATTTTIPDNTGQNMANLGASIGAMVQQQNAMRACMASKGYTLRRN